MPILNPPTPSINTKQCFQKYIRITTYTYYVLKTLHVFSIYYILN